MEWVGSRMSFESRISSLPRYTYAAGKERRLVLAPARLPWRRTDLQTLVDGGDSAYQKAAHGRYA